MVQTPINNPQPFIRHGKKSIKAHPGLQLDVFWRKHFSIGRLIFLVVIVGPFLRFTLKQSTAIYKAWKEKHKGTSRITGSATADKRAALVDYFRDEGESISLSDDSSSSSSSSVHSSDSLS